MAQWEVQMHELTRELSARLDSKMGALGQLIREADRAAARLETALARAQGAVTLPSAPAKTTETAREVLRVADGLDGSRANQADGLKPRRESSSSLASSLEPARGAAADGLSSHHRYDEIYILADYGHSPAEIAQRLGIPIGEVELILSLRSKR
jgi:DNA-directed RNA polymerase specialized sigma24 family protein